MPPCDAVVVVVDISFRLPIPAVAVGVFTTVAVVAARSPKVMWPHGSHLGFLRLLRFRAHGRGVMIVDKDQKEVDYDPRFRLYVQTRLSNPHYQPEVAAQTTLANFMITEAGLIIALSRCDREKSGE